MILNIRQVSLPEKSIPENPMPSAMWPLSLVRGRNLSRASGVRRVRTAENSGENLQCFNDLRSSAHWPSRASAVWSTSPTSRTRIATSMKRGAPPTRWPARQGPARELRVLVYDADERKLVRVEIPLGLVRRLAENGDFDWDFRRSRLLQQSGGRGCSEARRKLRKFRGQGPGQAPAWAPGRGHRGRWRTCLCLSALRSSKIASCGAGGTESPIPICSPDSRAGDEEALSSLMVRHERRLYGIAYGYLRNSEDALEVVQDAFVKLFQQSERIDTRAEVGAWLTRVAINAAIDRYRQKKRRGSHEVGVEAEDLQHVPARHERGRPRQPPHRRLAARHRTWVSASSTKGSARS